MEKRLKETLIFYQNELSAMGPRPLEPPKIKNNKTKLTENHKEALINQSFLKFKTCCFLLLFLSVSISLWAMDNKGDMDDILAELNEDYAQSTQKVYDPLEPVNRFMFNVNDKLYFYAFKPVANIYSEIVPKNFREGISRAFSNIKYPIRGVNDILQLKFICFFKETGRFILNTFLGFGGLLDVASGINGLSPPPPADTGLTFGKWGIGHGIYLVLPVLGPTTLRDGIGEVGDYFLNPISYVDPYYTSTLIKVEDKLNYLSFHIGEYEDLKSSAIDPYVAFKNAYIQHRDSLLSE